MIVSSDPDRTGWEMSHRLRGPRSLSPLSRRCRAAMIGTLVALFTSQAFAQAGVTATAPHGEVFVIGTVHAPRGLLLDSAYSAAHLRVALERFQPTMIGVEATPLAHAWGLYQYATWEIQHVITPWAVARRVPVYGIDWQNIDDAGVRRRLASLRQSDTQPPPPLAERQREAQRVAALVDQMLAGDFADPEHRHWHEWFLWINSGARNEAAPVVEWWGQASRDDAPGRSVRLLSARDDRIVNQAVTLLRRYPASRLAILIGFSHKPDLDRKLAKVPGVRVMQLTDLPRFTPADVRRAWAAEDAIAALRETLDGNAYYFNPSGTRLELARRHLAALREHGVDTDLRRYYDARLCVVEGRLEEATGLLRGIIARPRSPGAVGLGPWEGVLSVQQLARLELGKVHDLRGQRDMALKEYRELLTELDGIDRPVPDDSVFVNLVDWVTRAAPVAGSIVALREVRGIVRTLLREPWLLRGRIVP